MHADFWVGSLVVLAYLLVEVKCRGVRGPFFIQSVANCQFLDVLNEVKCAGAKVITSPLGPRKTQKWMLVCTGDSVMIVSCYNGMALDVEGGGRKSRGGLVLWPVNRCPNQRWIFDCNGVVRSKVKNLVLDVCNPKPGKLSLVGVYPRHAKFNQKFKIIPANCCAKKKYAWGRKNCVYGRKNCACNRKSCACSRKSCACSRKSCACGLKNCAYAQKSCPCGRKHFGCGRNKWGYGRRW